MRILNCTTYALHLCWRV